MVETVKEAWGMSCPSCGRDDQIDIQAKAWLRLCANGTDATEATNGSHEWGDDDAAACEACGYRAAVRDFA